MRTMRLGALLLPFSLACGSAGGFQDDDDNGNPDGGNPGSGAFVQRTIDRDIRHGQGVDVVDIDRDGDLDVVVALSLTDAIYLYVNDGSGGFDRVAVGGNIVGMETESVDLDGDGDLDIAAVGLFDRAQGFGPSGQVSWFENPGDVNGVWTRNDVTGLDFVAPIYVESADLTGDGNMDLIVGSIDVGGAGNGVHWFRNTGGTFSGAMAIDADLLGVYTVQVHDVDADGVLDVVAGGRDTNELAWYENDRADGTMDPAPTFTKRIIAMTDQPHDIQLVNMDADAELEIVATLTRGAGAVAYFDQTGAVTDPWMERSITEAFGAEESARTAVADFDGDGNTDVMVNSFQLGEIRLYTADGSGGFEEETITGAYPGANFLAAGDVDGDGKPDLISSTYENSGSADIIAWWRNEK